ncbi:LysR family transcriptional regulator [Pseudomonas sp. NA-150]|uniref:LysR family transcriptional regulator n=1 Tax=Pseudomonas sp. NA-150 TaxID=3367525 RepID=UPI0037CC23E2
MNHHHLRHINLNMLVVFEALMRERSVTQAAASLFLGQPAVSSTLARLRELFGDPLFVRAGSLMQPTARSFEIAALLEPALDSITQAVAPRPVFDPSTAEGVFHIAVSDDVEFALLPRLLKHLRIEAPRIVLVVHRANYLTMPRLIAEHKISMGIAHTRDLPAAAKRKILRPIRTVMIRGDSAPGALSLDQFCARPQAMVSFLGGVLGVVDSALEALKRKRQVMLVVPQFNGLGALLAGTDLIAVVPDYTAHVFSQSGEIRAEPVPVGLPEYDLHLVWHSCKDLDPAERWLRSRMVTYMAETEHA